MKNAIVILVGLAVFVGGLAGAGSLTPRINRERAERNLTVSDVVYDLPADMAIAQAALGVFRGLAINILWERAETLKNQGKFHDAIELGTLITKLQPRYPKVWEWVSWNLAYNISVATHTPEERWMWVKAGIDMLQRRGGGIDANPNELSIYQQLGWIYYHKVGEFLDNMSWHYKREVADIWHSVLGPPPRTQQEYTAWLTAIVEAPDRVENLPEGPRRLARWLQENGHSFDRHTLRRFTVPTRFPDVPTTGTLEEALAERDANSQASRPVPELSWPEFATPADIEALLPFLRKKAITSDELNMDPVFMRELGERFGPIDWRHPAAHTVYWSQLGLERLRSDEGRYMDNYINTRRNVLNGLERLAQAGQVVYQAGEEPSLSYVSYLPAWNFWLSFDDYFQGIVDEFAAEDKEVEFTLEVGHRNKMSAAIATAFAFGDTASADALYRRMQQRFADDPQAVAEYSRPLQDFALDQFQEHMEQPTIMRGLIVGLITQSITETVVHRNPPKAEAQVEMARRLHEGYRALNPNPSDPLYQEMPDLDVLRVHAIASFVSGNAGPVGVQQLPLLARRDVYLQLSPEVRALIYLQHGRELEEEATIMGYDLAELFPPPPDDVMQRVARDMAQMGGQNQPGGVRSRQETR